MANEVRLIEANALINHMKDLPTRYADGGGSWLCLDGYPNGMFDPEDVISSIENATTVDAVEVVRCKDCKHWKCWRISGEGSGDCCLDEGYATLATQHYDFCSYGERKDNG